LTAEIRQVFTIMHLDNLLSTCENEFQALGLEE